MAFRWLGDIITSHASQSERLEFTGGLVNNLPITTNSWSPFGEQFVVRNQWFNGQEIQIDGWHFVSCRFDNCQIKVGSQHFKLENCFVDDKSLLIIQDGPCNIVRLFHLRNKYMVEKFPFYAPKFNADGTFTVGVME